MTLRDNTLPWSHLKNFIVIPSLQLLNLRKEYNFLFNYGNYL